MYSNLWMLIIFKWSDCRLQQTFSFCRYPFVFDAEAKTTLLQTDAVMQMQVSYWLDKNLLNLANWGMDEIWTSDGLKLLKVTEQHLTIV